MKTCIISIICVLVICLLLGALCYAEFGSFNFARVGLALSNLTGGDGVYQVADHPEKVWLSGSEDAFRAYLEAEGYRLLTEEQLGSRIPVEKDGIRDYVFWSVNAMYHKWTWDTCGEPARGQQPEPTETILRYVPESVTGSAYFYPETEAQVTVTTNYTLTFAYPAWSGGWRITAHPDGTLTGENGLEYDCLYWEGSEPSGWPMDEGFCVSGGETAAFLEDALAKLGLTRREANAFLIHWLPQMENNAYNLICFQTDAAGLDLSPAPDTHIRVFMTWKALDEPIDIAPQILTAPARTGFTVVQWGGGVIK